jgi:GT2 family glycosyltransferase
MTRPLISIVTPVFNPAADVLEACLQSVRRQNFAAWEHCLVDDASTAPGVREILDAAAQSDDRVRLARRSENGGIVAASNDALQLARGDYVAFLDHDDLLADGVLAEVAAALTADPTIDYLYTDEDHLTASGQSFSRVYKPDWSPERFRSHMYTCHLSVVRRELAIDAGGLRSGYEGSQDYDLILRVTERARSVAHLPILGYHWRMGVDSTAANPHAKPYAHAAGLRAVADHCDRVGIPAEVEMLDYQGYHRLRRRVGGRPRVSVVMPTAGSSDRVWGRTRTFVVDALRDLMERASYNVHEVVLVADPRTPPAVVATARKLCGDRLLVVRGSEQFDFSAAINIGAAHADGDLLLLLNDDVQIIDDDFLETMIGLIQDVGVGVVGCRLLYADGTLQHAGHVYNGGAYHAFLGHGTDQPGPNGLLLVDREVSGVTAACMLVRRAVFEEVGGFSRSFPVNFNDVDFCLKVRRQGHRILYTPHASLYHFESGTRRNVVTGAEEDAIRARWAEQLDHDPYHHPALLKRRDDWAVPYGAHR